MIQPIKMPSMFMPNLSMEDDNKFAEFNELSTVSGKTKALSSENVGYMFSFQMAHTFDEADRTIVISEKDGELVAASSNYYSQENIERLAKYDHSTVKKVFEETRKLIVDKVIQEQEITTGNTVLIKFSSNKNNDKTNTTCHVFLRKKGYIDSVTKRCSIFDRDRDYRSRHLYREREHSNLGLFHGENNGIELSFVDTNIASEYIQSRAIVDGQEIDLLKLKELIDQGNESDKCKTCPSGLEKIMSGNDTCNLSEVSVIKDEAEKDYEEPADSAVTKFIDVMNEVYDELLDKKYINKLELDDKEPIEWVNAARSAFFARNYQSSIRDSLIFGAKNNQMISQHLELAEMIEKLPSKSKKVIRRVMDPFAYSHVYYQNNLKNANFRKEAIARTRKLKKDNCSSCVVNCATKREECRTFVIEGADKFGNKSCKIDAEYIDEFSNTIREQVKKLTPSSVPATIRYKTFKDTKLNDINFDNRKKVIKYMIEEAKKNFFPLGIHPSRKLSVEAGLVDYDVYGAKVFYDKSTINCTKSESNPGKGNRDDYNNVYTTKAKYNIHDPDSFGDVDLNNNISKENVLYISDVLDWILLKDVRTELELLYLYCNIDKDNIIEAFPRMSLQDNLLDTEFDIVINAYRLVFNLLLGISVSSFFKINSLRSSYSGDDEEGKKNFKNFLGEELVTILGDKPETFQALISLAFEDLSRRSGVEGLVECISSGYKYASLVNNITPTITVEPQMFGPKSLVVKRTLFDYELSDFERRVKIAKLLAVRRCRKENVVLSSYGIERLKDSKVAAEVPVVYESLEYDSLPEKMLFNKEEPKELVLDGSWLNYYSDFMASILLIQVFGMMPSGINVSSELSEESVTNIYNLSRSGYGTKETYDPGNERGVTSLAYKKYESNNVFRQAITGDTLNRINKNIFLSNTYSKQYLGALTYKKCGLYPKPADIYSLLENNEYKWYYTVSEEGGKWNPGLLIKSIERHIERLLR